MASRPARTGRPTPRGRCARVGRPVAPPRPREGRPRGGADPRPARRRRRLPDGDPRAAARRSLGHGPRGDRRRPPGGARRRRRSATRRVRRGIRSRRRRGRAGVPAGVALAGDRGAPRRRALHRRLPRLHARFRVPARPARRARTPAASVATADARRGGRHRRRSRGRLSGGGAWRLVVLGDDVRVALRPVALDAHTAAARRRGALPRGRDGGDGADRRPPRTTRAAGTGDRGGPCLARRAHAPGAIAGVGGPPRHGVRRRPRPPRPGGRATPRRFAAGRGGDRVPRAPCRPGRDATAGRRVGGRRRGLPSRRARRRDGRDVRLADAGSPRGPARCSGVRQRGRVGGGRGPGAQRRGGRSPGPRPGGQYRRACRRGRLRARAREGRHPGHRRAGAPARPGVARPSALRRGRRAAPAPGTSRSRPRRTPRC